VAVLTGGGKLDTALADVARKLASSDAVKVGFLEGATYPDGTSVAMVAAIQNFGAPARGIPPRPFFSNMVSAKSPGWGASLARVLKASNYDATTALRQMGAGIAGQLQTSITETNAPPLAEATIARKGFVKPLVDTGHMQDSVDFEVTKGGG